MDPRQRGDDDAGRPDGPGNRGLSAAFTDAGHGGDADAPVTPGSPLAARPAWLLPRPIPLHDRRPRLLRGPERLESGWWDGGDARRDYYVLETSQGQRAWAFAPPGEQGGWMLQGWFA